MEWNVAAAAGQRADIVDDGAFAVPTEAACWMNRHLLLYLGHRSARDCLREAV